MSAALPSPRVFSIAAGLPFADALAAGLLARAGRDPLQLARMLVLLPTRRACRSVREAFLRLTDGKPLLLPRLQPIGDIDDEETTLQAEPGVGADAETPPAIESLRRQMLLARRIMADADKSAEQAAYLAAALAELLDQLQTERVPFASLAGLVPDELAEHWQRTLEFLAILTDDWPRLIAAEHAVDPAARRDRLLGAQARRWRERPPDFPVFAAGSTGTIPATADLLAAIAGLPDGAVVLPGLDRNLDDAAWDTLEPTHPQFGMSRLLAHLGVARTQVVDWPLPEASATPDAIGAARAVLVNEALRPAESTDRWRDADHAKAALEPAFATPLVYVECPTPREEAGVIALAMREALEVAGRTAALITPDRQLARRVAAELRRWNVEIDDSAGTPLGSTPPGAFLRLIAQAAAADWSPVALLATLKHPLASLGAAQGAFRARVRALELAVVRGPRPAPGFAGLLARLEQSVAEGDLTPARAAPLAEFLDRLRAAAAPLDALMVAREATLPALVRAHVVVAETLAQSSDGRGADRLWAGDNGESAGRYVADLAAAAADFPAIPPRQYADLFAGFMVGTNVRPRAGRHPRLAILGLLEARLVRYDRMILAGLNEGTWPPLPPADPWLSRPMRAQLGLSSPDRRIGLAAHDFAQAFAARDVMLTRSLRAGGAPTVPSRFLMRLESLLTAIGAVERVPGGFVETKGMSKLRWRSSGHLQWQAALGEPVAPSVFAQPAFAPPRSARPDALSVTQIEMLRRDPYAFYARHILRLNAVDPLEAEIDAAERGNAIHRALDRFVKRYPSGKLPPDAEHELLAFGRLEYGARLAEPAVSTFWWPRFERIAQWFVAEERRRRGDLDVSFGEQRGTKLVVFGEHRLTLSARADRIDRRRDGALVIVDYKTGSVPTSTEVNQGYAPQLPLEALLARAGGFPGIDEDTEVAALEYWRLTGGDSAGSVSPAGGPKATVEGLVEYYRERLHSLIAYFADPTHAYRARPRAKFALRYNDYEHLERIAEWSSLRERGDA